MSDYERYGDYNEIEEDAPKSKNPVLIFLKIMTAVVCIGVIGLIAFRLIAFNTYPKAMKNLYYNETLEAYCSEKGKDADIKTQALRAPYDDPDIGNFFCDYLYVIEDIDQLQITVRYNKATVTRIAKKLGAELDSGSGDLFTYRLYASYGEGKEGLIGELSYSDFDSLMMYRYHKLVFDNVDISTDELGSPYWIRLEILVNGYETEEPYMIPVYENNEGYSSFDKYKN